MSKQGGSGGSVRAQPFLDADRRRAEEWAEKMRQRALGEHTPPPLRPLKKAKLRRRRHLVIGDSHAHPDTPNHRFEWLGRMIAEREPDVVVDIGDSADMASLLGYEKGNKGPIFEGHRYWMDVEAYIDAKERMADTMRPCSPRLVKTDGNHEHRIERLLTVEPRFVGVVGPHNLMDKELGWERYPYGEPVEIDGIHYCHAFMRYGREIGGVMPTRSVALKLGAGVTRVQGHSHQFQWYEQGDAALLHKDRLISTVHAGCYFDVRGEAHRWANDDVRWWRPGILEVEVEGGQIHSHTWTSLQDVQAMYG